MSDLQAIADRFEIEALRGEFTDAGMMRDYDRFASLFTQDGVWQIPDINVEFVSREEIRAGIERLQGLWEYFVQTVHPGTIRLEGDTAVGRAYKRIVVRDDGCASRPRGAGRQPCADEDWENLGEPQTFERHQRSHRVSIREPKVPCFMGEWQDLP